MAPATIAGAAPTEPAPGTRETLERASRLSLPTTEVSP
jgi:hypothetical protein